MFSIYFFTIRDETVCMACMIVDIKMKVSLTLIEQGGFKKAPLAQKNKINLSIFLLLCILELLFFYNAVYVFLWRQILYKPEL